MNTTALPVFMSTLILHSSWGLCTPPAALGVRHGQRESCRNLCQRHSDRRCSVRHVASPGRASGTKDNTSFSASSVSSSIVDGSWGLGSSCLSSWISGIASSLSRTTLRVSCQASRGGRWIMGGTWGGGGRGDGTDNGASSEGSMGNGEGDNGYGGVSGIPWDSTRDFHSPPGCVQPLQGSLGLLPWMWFSALWTFYMIWLEKFPLMTKAMTAGLLALGGDLVAQCVEYRRGDSKDPPGKDKRRMLAVVVDSAVVTGPTLHAMYGALEFFFPTSGGGWLPALLHLVIDIVLFDPIFVASFFCVTGVLENRPLLTDVLPGLRREYWPAVRGAWAVSLVFSPLQYVTFRFMPLELRVLSVNICDLAWTSVLSYFSHKREKATQATATATAAAVTAATATVAPER